MGETRDVIRERMLSLLSDRYDKLPGSWIWEIYQSAAIEFENEQLAIEDGLDQAFAGTADLENLKVMAFEDRGIVYRDATFATTTLTVRGVENAVVLEGDLFANELLQYEAIETVTIDSTLTANVKVKCTTAGSVGNTPVGTIIYFPKSLNGVNSVTNLQAVIDGYDEEGRTSLLERYYLEVRYPATSGNSNHYIQWALSITGVGKVKIKPLWNGNGTVKVVLLDSNSLPASQALITKVAEYIETQRPIGASVTVVAPDEFVINIGCKISLKSDYDVEQVKITIQDNINKYFKETSFVDQTIYYAKVGSIIFNTEGVNNIDYNNFNMNSAKTDIMLLDANQSTQIAKLGTLTITV